MGYVYLLAGIGLIAIVAVALWVVGVPQRVKRWFVGPMFVICINCTRQPDVDFVDGGCVTIDPCMVGVCKPLVPDNYPDCECVVVPKCTADQQCINKVCKPDIDGGMS